MTLVATGSGGAGTMLRPTVSRLALFFILSQFYRNLRQRLTYCRSDQGPAVTKTGGRRGRERAGAAGKGTAREDGRDGQGRAASKNGCGGQGRARRGRQTRAVLRQRPLPAHHRRASASGRRRRTANAAAIAEAIAAASLAAEIAAAAASDFERVD